MTENAEPVFRGNRAVAWGADGVVTKQDALDRDKSTVAQPAAADLGPVSGQTSPGGSEGAATAAGFDVAAATVPELVAHIREPADQDEARDRAANVWRAEVVREAGIRSGVEDEVGRWLSDDEVASILADADEPDSKG